MRFIYSLFFAVFIVYGLDFDFEVEKIYHLDQNDFYVKDGVLYVKHIDNKPYNQSNKSIITKDSKVVIDKNINYYYHTNKFMGFQEDLIKLDDMNGFYIANVREANFKNCFMIIKYTESKKMHTKSDSMVLDISSLDSNVDSKAYFTCLKSNNYIY